MSDSAVVLSELSGLSEGLSVVLASPWPDGSSEADRLAHLSRSVALLAEALAEIQGDLF